MKPTSFCAVLGLAALLLTACHEDNAGRDPDADPAGTRPAPTAQEQAAPQTEPNTPQGEDAQPPAPMGRSYDECMRTANAAKSEGEREVLARTCANLRGAPKP